MPPISLVIPVRNEEHSLRELLASIAGQTRRPDEVILVDGGSTDRTVAVARELTAGDPRVQVIEAGDATPGRGRNVGIAAAKFDHIALTDAGLRLEPGWLAGLAEVVERRPEVRVVYGHYEPVIDSYFLRCAALAYVPPTEPREGGRSRGPSTASMLLHRSVWEELGGFPDARAAEDLMFMERVEHGGYEIGWAPAAVVHWRIQPTLRRTVRRFVLYSKHNVWAGRQRYWHYGVARQYAAAAVVAGLGVALSPWWFVLLPAGGLARVARTIRARRHDVSPAVRYNPLVFAGVGLVLAAIDAATFIGWAQALLQRPPHRPAAPAVPQPPLART